MQSFEYFIPHVSFLKFSELFLETAGKRIFEILPKSFVVEGFCSNVAVSRSETLLLKMDTNIYYEGILLNAENLFSENL